MFRNPAKIRTLFDDISYHQHQTDILTNQLFLQKRLVPVGYRLMGEGEEVTNGCLVFNESEWTESTLAIGCRINENGYISNNEVSKVGYLYASPIVEKSVAKHNMNGQWICNECNQGTLPSSVTEAEIELELHACIECGGFEFHFVNHK